MNLLDEILLDQDIICRALTLATIVLKDNDDITFFTKEMRDRLPILLKKEYEKLYLYERKNKR